MRIALVTTTFLPRIGGAEFVIHNLAMQWADQGHEVCVINPDTAEATHAQGKYTVKQFKLLRGSTRFGYHHLPMAWYGTKQIKRALDDFKPDFISAHFAYPTGYLLARIRPLPRFLVTCHGSDIVKFHSCFRKRYEVDKQVACGLNKSAGAIAISSYARKLMEELGVESSHILDIPNGVDVEKFQTRVEVDIRSKLQIPDDAILILSLGANSEQKAFDKAIKGFAKLRSRVPNAYYLILGKGATKLRLLAEELGVDKEVILCDGLHGDELVGAYQQADIFFSSSVWEMLSLVVLEAMAAGLPQVVTNVSGSQDVIKDGINGFVVKPNAVDAMAEALYKLAMDKSLREEFGRKNIENSQLYSWDRISRLYLEYAG